METIIKLSPEELNENLLKKIRQIINGNTNIDVTISLKEFDPEYVDALKQSIHEAESGNNLTSFTMEDFMAYEPTKS